MGSEEVLESNFRLIAATNRSLQQEVQSGKFREDLLFRIAVIVIDIPPLSQRREDIPILARFFIEQVNASQGTIVHELSENCLKHLQTLPLSGNVRELKNLIQRAAVLTDKVVIEAKDIRNLPAFSPASKVPSIFEQTMSYREAKIKLERMYITEQLRLHGWNITHTAQALNLIPNNLMRKMKTLGIKSNPKI